MGGLAAECAAERRVSVSLFERIQPNAAGVDCGQKSHFVANCRPNATRPGKPVREFRTFTADLQRLAQWLAQCGVKTVAMESTGVYWIPLYRDPGGARLRGAAGQCSRRAQRAWAQTSDVKDCEWLSNSTAWGLLRASFRPAAAMVPLRSYLRQRAILVEENHAIGKQFMPLSHEA